MPLYRCTDCGFVTTASQKNAVAAHGEGAPTCGGVLELIADFKSTPSVVLPVAGGPRRALDPPPDARSTSRPG